MGKFLEDPVPAPAFYQNISVAIFKERIKLEFMIEPCNIQGCSSMQKTFSFAVMMFPLPIIMQ
jgi:hypothetical protein